MSDPQVAIVTAAGGGMGEAVARELHARGYRLVLMSRSEAVERLGEELGAVAVRGDVCEGGDIERVVMAALEEHGRIDAVVNHSGHPPKGELLEIPDEQWHRGLDMMLLSVVRMARLVTPTLLRQGRGSFVNITTYATFEPELIFPVSASIRAALHDFAKLYVERYGPEGLRMNCVMPGFIDSIAQPEERIARIPMKRQGRVAEIAATVAFLLSDEAAYINGQSIRVDGGLARHV